MDELREMVLSFPDPQACPECPYRSDKVDNLVKHMALGHSKLDELLLNDELVAQKRAIAMNKPTKVKIGECCPVCDQKFPKGTNRDHVSWHYMDELRDFVRSTGSEKACAICYYTTDKLDNLVKHYALGHSKLDELLQDEQLLQEKRAKAKKKPKRMTWGKECPICGQTGRDRDHVARHFLNELLDVVAELPVRSQCNMCEYHNSNKEYMAKHIALFHCKLDELMQNEELVNSKKAKAANQPKKISMGATCIICQTPAPSREHVARHFNDELCKIVAEKSPSPLSCPECSFTAEKAEYVARHMALVHCYIDQLVQQPELVERKLKEYQGSAAAINQAATAAALPTKQLPMREAVRKSQRQREAEERQAQKQREEEERRKEEERERKRRREEERERKRAEEARRAAAAAEAAAAAAEAKAKAMENVKAEEKMESNFVSSPPPVKMARIQATGNKAKNIPNTEAARPVFGQGLPRKVANPLMRNLPQQQQEPPSSSAAGGSLLLKTLMRGAQANPYQQHHQQDPQPDKKPGSLSIKIKRAVANGGSKEEYTIVKGPPAQGEETEDEMGEESHVVGYHELDPNAEMEDAVDDEDNELECEPDISQLMVISHNMEGEEDEDEEDDEECAGVEAVIEDDEDEEEEEEEDMEEVDPTLMLQQEPLVVEQHAIFREEEEDGGEERPMSGASIANKRYDSCPVCEEGWPSAEHVTRHFAAELMEVVQCFPDPPNCSECGFQGQDLEDLAMHVGVTHGQTESCLADASLVGYKKNEIFAASLEASPQTVRRRKCGNNVQSPVLLPPSITLTAKPRGKKRPFADISPGHAGGASTSFAAASASPSMITCPICDQMISKQHSRDHLVWHFMDNLRAMLDENGQCPQCQNYRCDKTENAARHLALAHGQLDVLLSDPELVAEKRAKYAAKPKKVHLGSTCPICDFKDPPREHVSR